MGDLDRCQPIAAAGAGCGADAGSVLQSSSAGGARARRAGYRMADPVAGSPGESWPLSFGAGGGSPGAWSGLNHDDRALPGYGNHLEGWLAVH